MAYQVYFRKGGAYGHVGMVVADTAGDFPTDGTVAEGSWGYARDDDSLYVFDGASWNVAGGGGGGGAPTTADYLVKTANGSLSAERVVTDTASVAWDWATAGQAKANVQFGTGGTVACVGNDSRLSDSRAPTGSAGGDLTGTYPNPTVGANKVTLAKFVQATATDKLLGRETAGSGDFEELNALRYRNPMLSAAHPDRVPSNAAISETWLGNSAALTWRWANQSDATATIENDGLRFEKSAHSGVDRSVLWTTGPDGSTTDFVWAVKVAALSKMFRATNQFFVALLAAGSEGTPTTVYVFTLFQGTDGGITLSYSFQHWSTYGGASTADGTDASGIIAMYLPHLYMALHYQTSSKALTAWVAADGYGWRQHGNTVTLGAHPTTSMGIGVDSSDLTAGPSVRVHWARALTSAAQNAAPYFTGA